MFKRYLITEIFYSLQGEGIRAGRPSLFVRFAGCNMKCSMKSGKRSPGGFDCDTDFKVRQQMTAEEIALECKRLAPSCKWIVLTGGEPALHIDSELLVVLKRFDFRLAIETNGTLPVSREIDWITVSPKVQGERLKQRFANEVKYVLTDGQDLPEPEVKAEHKLLSPAFKGNEMDRKALDWCVRLVQENPEWRLSVQLHKLWGVR
jgi:organic radical activating enzyme